MGRGFTIDTGRVLYMKDGGRAIVIDQGQDMGPLFVGRLRMLSRKTSRVIEISMAEPTSVERVGRRWGLQTLLMAATELHSKPFEEHMRANYRLEPRIIKIG